MKHYLFKTMNNYKNYETLQIKLSDTKKFWTLPQKLFLVTMIHYKNYESL